VHSSSEHHNLRSHPSCGSVRRFCLFQPISESPPATKQTAGAGENPRLCKTDCRTWAACVSHAPVPTSPRSFSIATGRETRLKHSLHPRALFRLRGQVLWQPIRPAPLLKPLHPSESAPNVRRDVRQSRYAIPPNRRNLHTGPIPPDG
jgi:hypothetical protein